MRSNLPSSPRPIAGRVKLTWACQGNSVTHNIFLRGAEILVKICDDTELDRKTSLIPPTGWRKAVCLPLYNHSGFRRREEKFYLDPP
jgi:hypothetical protein